MHFEFNLCLYMYMYYTYTGTLYFATDPYTVVYQDVMVGKVFLFLSG